MARKLLLALVFIATLGPLVGSLPAAAQAPTITNRLPLSAYESSPQTATSNAIDRLDVEAAIRSIYDRFTEVSRLSGQEILFTISDIKTYRPDRFEALKWFDLYSLPTGMVMDSVPTSMAGRLPSQDRVSWQSKWTPYRGGFGTGDEFSRAASSLTVPSALAMIEEDESQRHLRHLPKVAALSSFLLSVAFDGQARQYRAMVIWRPLSPDLVSFALYDQVVPGVDRVFTEDRIIVEPNKISGDDRGEAAPEGCGASFFDVLSEPLNIHSFEGHSTGNHNASLRLGRTCRTTASCISQCTPYNAWTECADWGEIATLFHRHVKFTAHQSATEEGFGVGVASNCGYAFGCAIQECLFGSCSTQPTFGFSGRGASINVRILGALIGNLGLQSGGNCPAARIFPEGPPRCGESATSVLALEHSGGGAVDVDLGTEILLHRLEPSAVAHKGHKVDYLMAEWAVVRTDARGVPELNPFPMIAASGSFSDQTASEVMKSYTQLVPGSALVGERTVLFVAAPIHETNSRAIAIPDLRLDSPLPRSITERGNVLVMADFGEDQVLQGLDLLHAEELAGSRPLMLHLERSLRLEPTTERHRVVTFAWLKVGETIEVESYLSYLPRCCCGTQFCD